VVTRRATIGRVLVGASVILVIMGGNQAVGAQPRSAAQVPQQHELAAFAWYKLSQLNANITHQRLRSLRAAGFTTIYAELGEYLEIADQPASQAQQARLSQLSRDLKRFVANAANLGLAVQGVGGGPNWIDTERRYLGPKLVQLVAQYNTTAAAKERLQGVQLDIEPYVDPSFFDDQQAALTAYLETLHSVVATYRQVRSQSGNSSLRLGFAIPFWFDGPPGTPEVTYGEPGIAETTKAAAFHLLDMLRLLPDAYVLVMSYRNVTSGPDGSIAHAHSEFAYASSIQAQCGLVVGQEFGDVQPPKVTFYGLGRAAFELAAEEITAAFDDLPQFRGLSVNDIDAYLAAPA
jgi:DNA-binding transcriptional regulator YhcF (GntR family)